WFGSSNYGASGSVKDIASILDCSAFPKLTHFGLMNCEWVGDGVRALMGSKLLKQLESLDLSMGCLGDVDIDAMLARKELFSHLAHLNVEDSALTDASKPKVKQLAKEANFGKEQSPDRVEEDGYRYVSVGE
ncbi:MAG: molybdenum metabolism regulator, partial [Archangiaceae bacterium]|nr:molybdenum metabolism regulator [Archangiaceae bacterium]